MTQELELIANIEQPVAISWNKEDVEKFIAEVENRYKDLVVTEEELKSFAETRKKLSGLKKAISDQSKSVKKTALLPIDQFLKDMKSFEDRVGGLYDNLFSQEKQYEEKYRQERLDKVLELIEEWCSSAEVDTKLIKIDDKWLNKTQKESDTVQAIAYQITLINEQKKAEQEKIEMIKALCESSSQGLKTPLDSQVYINMKDKQIQELKMIIMYGAERQKNAENPPLVTPQELPNPAVVDVVETFFNEVKPEVKEEVQEHCISAKLILENIPLSKAKLLKEFLVQNNISYTLEK